MKKDRVVVGLSGGVDSSVAAYLLKQEGYEVIGMFMKNWHDDSVILDNECPWIQDSNDALMVAEKLDIPYYVIDFSEEYKKDIVDYMFDAYKNGLTPNPDVLCNYHIKFGHFLRHARKIGAKYVATGHYARKEVLKDVGGNISSNDYQLYNTNNYRLLKGVDPKKDQSYFLSYLNNDQLECALFPIGHLTKDEVRKIAADNDLVTADKKDSQGLCFVGNIKLTDFLSQQLKPKAGVCIDADTNEIVGQHKGAHFYTRGQRKGLGISGADSPYYVAHKDIKDNILYVTKDKNSNFINSYQINIDNINMIDFNTYDNLKDDDVIDIQFQYHGKLYGVNVNNVNLYSIFKNHNNELGFGTITAGNELFYAPERGQFLVGYYGDKLLFSGKIGRYE